MGKQNRQYTMNCKNVFIEYYVSLFENKCFMKNMSTIFPYLDTNKIVGWSDAEGEDKYLDNIESLWETKEYFSRSIALDKAIQLFKRMFEGETVEVERGIRNNRTNSTTGMTICRKRNKNMDGNEVGKTFEAEFDEEGFVRNLLNKFFRNVNFRLRIANVYKDFRMLIVMFCFLLVVYLEDF